MITFTHLLFETWNTETIIPEKEYMDISLFLDLMGEWNEREENKPLRVLCIVPLSGNLDYRLYKENEETEKDFMTWKEVVKFIDFFTPIFPHSWSDGEFKAYIKDHYFKDKE